MHTKSNVLQTYVHTQRTPYLPTAQTHTTHVHTHTHTQRTYTHTHNAHAHTHNAQLSPHSTDIHICVCL